MNPRELGFLLLCSSLGDPERPVLTQPQLRSLAQRILSRQQPGEDRELTLEDLIRLGYGPDMAIRILKLLAGHEQLEYYLRAAERCDCSAVTRLNDRYPLILRKRLGQDSPGCLWVKGDAALLERPGIALVGSRELSEENRRFAQEVGRQAALQGLTLISGNARGADRTAQDACLEAGGYVVSVVADELRRQSEGERIVYVSEGGFDMGFSAQRALSRNRLIHALGRVVFVAQCRLGAGGTWDGVRRNLRSGWSQVACYRDGSEAVSELEQMGAFCVGMEDLEDLKSLLQPQKNLFDE